METLRPREIEKIYVRHLEPQRKCEINEDEIVV